MAGVINHIVRGDWQDGGLGFVGFRFNGGAGTQSGWARVRMRDVSENFAFKVLDYAYADPGEPIKAGQRSSASQDAPEGGRLDSSLWARPGLSFGGSDAGAPRSE